MCIGINCYIGLPFIINYLEAFSDIFYYRRATFFSVYETHLHPSLAFTVRQDSTQETTKMAENAPLPVRHCWIEHTLFTLLARKVMRRCPGTGLIM